MNLTTKEWEFINTFPPWLLVFMAFLTVVVSLYTFYPARKISLKISSNIYDFNDETSSIVINVINNGYRTVFLNSEHSIVFQVGLFKKKNIGIGHKYIDFDNSSNFPCKLSENETARLHIRLITDGKDWLKNFQEQYLKRRWSSNLKIIVYPNIGKPFKVKIGKNIRDRLKSYKS